MGNPNWGEVVTNTLAHRRSKLADAISKNNILYHELRRRKRIKTIGGGRTITAPIMRGDHNPNFMWYSDREALRVADHEATTSAEFPWKQYACGVSISGYDMLINEGPAQVLNTLQTRIKHAEKTIENVLHQVGHGDGTTYSGKEFGGLQLLVSVAAGATVGGIDSSLVTWWDNYRKLTGGATTGAMYGDMLDLMLMLCRGTDKPNLILSDNTYYSTYSQSLQAQQRFMDGKLASGGFRNIMFEGTPVVADGGQGGYAPTGMRFLNMDTIELVMHKNRNNRVLGGPRRPVTEDSDTVIIGGMGNFIIDNRMLNGALVD